MPIIVYLRIYTKPMTAARKVYPKLKVIKDVLIVSFKEL